MFGALKRGRFRSLARLILVVNVVGELQRKRTLAASRGFLAAARLSCSQVLLNFWRRKSVRCTGLRTLIHQFNMATSLFRWSKCGGSVTISKGRWTFDIRWLIQSISRLFSSFGKLEYLKRGIFISTGIGDVESKILVWVNLFFG